MNHLALAENMISSISSTKGAILGSEIDRIEVADLDALSGKEQIRLFRQSVALQNEAYRALDGLSALCRILVDSCVNGSVGTGPSLSPNDETALLRLAAFSVGALQGDICKFADRISDCGSPTLAV